MLLEPYVVTLQLSGTWTLWPGGDNGHHLETTSEVVLTGVYSEYDCYIIMWLPSHPLWLGM